jgi:hypothetical protein
MLVGFQISTLIYGTCGSVQIYLCLLGNEQFVVVYSHEICSLDRHATH